MPYLRMLRLAFPAPPTGDERRALIHVLFFDLSERAFASLLAEYLDEERVVVLNEAIHVVNGPSPPPDLMYLVRVKLRGQGWDFDQE